jgi:hypothetical protein
MKNTERPWWETMPVEPQRYRDNRRIPMKKQKCMDTMAEILAINNSRRPPRKFNEGKKVKRVLRVGA